MDDLRILVADRVPIWKLLGLALERIDQQEAVFTGEFRADLSHHGVLHGGVVATMLDSVCAAAALAYTLPEQYATTIHLDVTYLKAVTSGKLRAVGTCLRPGRAVLYCEARIWNEAGELVATGSSQLMRIANFPSGAGPGAS